MNIEVMASSLTERQKEIKKNALVSCNKIECFEHEGRLYRGNAWNASVEYAYNNPTGGDFSVWLQQHYKEVGCTD